MTIDELNTSDRFAAGNGIVLLDDGATTTMTVAERHLNGAGVCQGGALFTLADLAAAGLTRGEQLTVASDIRYLHPARLGDLLVAKAALVSAESVTQIRTEICNQDGTLIATVDAKFVRPKKK